MSDTHNCPVCDTPLPNDAPRGLCPNCLLGSALGAAGVPVSSPSAKRFGDYELLGEIAQGGMGVVHYARQISLNRNVALKLIRSGQLASEAEVQRFRTEAEAAANLDHPNIVPIYEVGAQDGQHFFTMKLMEGGTLADLNAECGVRNAVWLRRAAELIATISHAVQHAHQRGVLHRDIKPTNILLDESGEPHLTDFGLAKLIQDRPDMTQSLAVIGTPGYMSPEQAAGRAKQLTTAADVYGLGAILFELITGQAPFKSDSTLEVLKQVQEREPPRPQKLNPNVDRDLETICLKCLEKEPARRYVSAEALAHDLERWLRDEPIHARPSTILERTAKWTRRNPVVAGLSVAAVLIFFTGLAGVLWQWRTAKAQAVRADQNAQRADESAAESRQRLARSHVVTGMRLLDEGAAFDAMLFLTEALKLESGLPAEKEHRVRLAAARRQSPRLTQLLDFGSVTTICAFNTDSSRLLIGGENGDIGVWDTESGAQVFGPLRLKGTISRLGFCDRDRALIVAASGGDGARIYDLDTSEVRRFFPHPNFQGLEISTNGLWLMTYGGRDDEYRLWNVESGEQLQPAVRHSGSEGFGNLSPDGRLFATSGADSMVILWDRATMKPRFQPLKQDGMVSDLFFNDDGSRLTVVNFRKSFQVWDTATGQPLGPPVPQRVIATLKPSPDQRWFAGVANRGMVKVWDAATGQLAFPELRHDANPGRVLFSPSGSRLLVGAADGTTYLWDYAREDPLAIKLRNSRRVNGIASDVDATRVATCSNDGFVRLWDCQPRKLAVSPWPESNLTLAHIGNARHLLTVASTGAARLCDSDTWSAAGPDFAVTNQIGRAWLTADGGRLIVQCVESNLYLLSPRAPRTRHFDFQTWDARTGRLLGGMSWQADAYGRAWASPAGDAVALARAGQLSAFDPVTWQVRWEKSYDKSVQFVTFSSTGARAAVLAGKEIHLINPVTGERTLEPMKVPVTPVYADFSPDGKTLATASGNSVGGQLAYLWDVETGEALTPPITHLDSIWCIRFSPDGRKVVTASTDHSARVWDARTGEPLTAPLKHSGQVNYAEFSPDSRWVVTAGDDGTVRVWDVVSGTALTAPLRHQTGVAYAGFLGDGRRLFTQTIVGDTQLRELPEDVRPVADWSALATLLSARRLNAAGSAEPVEAPALVELWTDLRARYPDDFRRDPTATAAGFPITSLPPGHCSNPFRMSSVFIAPH